MPLNTENFKYVFLKDVERLLPITGIYAFKSRKAVLYIGKAVNIRERVKNHIYQPVFKDSIFIPQTDKIGFIATGSEIEALILEAELIKKHQPKYNTQWKDNKNYWFVAITNEKFPRVFLTHQLQILNSEQSRTTNNYKLLTNAGPFVDGKALKQTLRVLRKVFPFRTCKILPKRPCLYKELNLCLAPCNIKYQIANLKYKSQKSNIKNLIAILQGQKNSVIKNLQKEMQTASKQQDFEKAKILRDQIFALENVFSHSHIFQKETSKTIDWQKTEKELQKLLGIETKIKRIEGYDISNIQGQEATGSMVVFEKGMPNKNEYRKFHVKIEGKPNDTAMLKEVLTRRLKHKEWPLSQIMLIDGGRGQLSAGLNIKYQIANIKYKSQKSNIKFMALAKRNNELFIEGKNRPILLKNLPQETANLILQIRDEAHRFAITYHKILRSKNFIQ
ncbi:MAG: UvrB/UvrC motif-containing protein [Candidatus Pacebacteria bacterium]|nr:UvrB/UvrC motif-containing protein [Candidatus Paceibacterota bacterium]